jgi:hypothetical protein
MEKIIEKEQKKIFNLIIISFSKENSRDFLNEFFCTKPSEKMIWTYETNESVFKGYIRWHGGIPISSPHSTADCLIYYVKNLMELEDDEYRNEIENYFNKRKGIPLKICNVENAIKSEHIFIDSSSILEFRSQIFERIINFDEILHAAFNEIDKEKTGFIGEKEIVELVNKLNFVRKI